MNRSALSVRLERQCFVGTLTFLMSHFFLGGGGVVCRAGYSLL